MNLNSPNSKSKQKSIINLRLNPRSNNTAVKQYRLNNKKTKDQSKNTIIKSRSRSLSNSQWILVLYNLIFFSVISAAIFLDWASIWQLPKVILFIVGVTGFLVLSSLLWIFGLIKNIVAITLGDILFIITGLMVVGITFLNPNRIAFWGSTSRMFDAGVFVGFIVIFYLTLKLFLEHKAIYILSFFISIFILLSAVIAAVVAYIPNILSTLSILTKLQPTYTWITESPQELVFLTLIAVTLIFLTLNKIYSKTWVYTIMTGLYYVTLLIHILLLIRLPGHSMYILTILTIIAHTLYYIKFLSKHNTTIQSNMKLILIRPFLASGIIILLLYTMLNNPFRESVRFPEYVLLANPDIELSLDIMKQSLQSDTWFGSSNIMYAWNRFASDSTEVQLPNFSFETLYNEIINIVVKNGAIVSGTLLLFATWILFSILRIILIQKTIPIETLTLILILTGLFLFPFTIVTKVICIIILVLWSNIFTRYFRPIIKFSLDIHKIPSSISSLFTFIILLSITFSVVVSSKMYNIVKSQEYILKANKVQNNLSEQTQLLSKAQMASPYMIEYAHLYMQVFIQYINEQYLELVNTSIENSATSLDTEKQKQIQENIIQAQKLIDEYRTKFELDSRVIYWQLDLYSIIHQYDQVEENIYLDNISKGRALKPKSQDWDIYIAQYYARQSQKGGELNSNELEQAKSILNDAIIKNQFSVEAYKNYYELLSLTNDYEEQIIILEKYVQLLIEKSMPADQELLYLLGLAYQNNKKYVEAITIYNKLLETFPDYTNVYYKLGEIYEVQKKNDLAIQNYKKVLELDPNAEAASLKLEQLQ